MLARVERAWVWGREEGEGVDAWESGRGMR